MSEKLPDKIKRPECPECKAPMLIMQSRDSKFIEWWCPGCTYHIPIYEKKGDYYVKTKK